MSHIRAHFLCAQYNSLFFSFDFNVRNDPFLESIYEIYLINKTSVDERPLVLKHNCRRTLCENEFALNVPLSVTQD